jgi:hypothetical protein
MVDFIVKAGVYLKKKLSAISSQLSAVSYQKCHLIDVLSQGTTRLTAES